MLSFEPKDLPVPKVHQYLLGGVGPRPIALVSTVSVDGAVNLSPFSFFNAFGANPPIVAFSPARRGRDGTVKDTYSNLIATRECVIQAVTYSMVHQVSLASAEYPSEVDEFVKSGLTAVPSDLVKPPRVGESPFHMECRLRQMVELGGLPASGNLAICEVVKFHIAEDILRDGVIHPDQIDLVARMSAAFYCRATGSAIFELPQPGARKCIGFDALPEYIRTSHVLSGNNLAQLAAVEAIPDTEAAVATVGAMAHESPGVALFERFARRRLHLEMLRVAVGLKCAGHPNAAAFMEQSAKAALDNNDVAFAWNALLYLGRLKHQV